MWIDRDMITNVGLAAARGAHLSACALLLGGVVFDRFVSNGCATANANRVNDRMLRVALAVAILSGVAWFVLIAMSMSGSSFAESIRSGAFALVWSQTHFGILWQIRTALAAGSTAVVIWIGCLAMTSRLRGAALDVGIFVNAALVLTLAGSGHGFTGRWSTLHGMADVIHLLVVAVWPTGLVPFLFYLRSCRGPDDMKRWFEIATVTRRFSTISFNAVFILAGSGVVNTICLVKHFPDVIHTVYGRILLLKILLFIMMLGLGAFNRIVLKPRINNLGASDIQHAVHRLQWNIAIESVIGLAVFAVTGVLGMLAPP